MPDVTRAAGRTFKPQRGRAGRDTIRRSRNDRNLVVSIRKDKVKPERSVRGQFHRLSIDRDFRLRMSAAVENDLGIDVHEEIPLRQTERAESF